MFVPDGVHSFVASHVCARTKYRYNCGQHESGSLGRLWLFPDGNIHTYIKIEMKIYKI